MFAECADITFMDAWLPKYTSEPRGTSLWICRTPLAAGILSRGETEGTLQVDPVGIQEIIASQNTLHWKRDMLEYRLLLMERNGEQCPKKRVKAGRGTISFLEREECRRYLSIQKESREIVFHNTMDEVGKWFAEAYHTPWSYRTLRILLKIYHFLLRPP
jgi:hypothetical protein